MKAKHVRQTIKALVKQGNGVSLYNILGAIWTKYPETTKRRIDRSLKKLIKWGVIRFDRNQKPEPLFYRGNQ